MYAIVDGIIGKMPAIGTDKPHQSARTVNIPAIAAAIAPLVVPRDHKTPPTNGTKHDAAKNA